MRVPGIVALACALIWQTGTALAVPLLPDMFAWASESRNYMYGGEVDVDQEPGRALYEFNVAIPNIGDGPFQVFEITDFENDIQDVYQDIFDSEGGYERVLIGTFELAPAPFGHLHLEGLAFYKLREVTEGGGVGEVVASHFKTSHGLVDSVPYDTSLPGAPATQQYTSASADLLGVSVGWADLYSRLISTQHIDVTGVPAGEYWLEVEIDPNNIIHETDDTNNVTRILIDLEMPPLEGDYNANGLVDAADYAVWLAALGGNSLVNEVASPGIVDEADYVFWKANFGNTYASTATGAAIPEPYTLLLFVTALIAVPIGRRNRAL